VPRLWNLNHGDAPEGARYIGRGTVYGNAFRIGRDGTREEVIAKYEDRTRRRLLTDPEFRVAVEALRGVDLVCHCHPLPCHGDVLLRLANSEG
jgi:hypothetical protein